ncbi:rhodanese-like domain-containing protein [Nocardioides coralli]|uniref:rhodanese-like domain-containing protein n=1 Tax=Nocardioides coralli TaxID=2872154 RepID=UPI001CA4357F|nr:rhodanese-like domain-containing protein [Nocardioides coralli]QZY29247.1 rhodanese-like domain-containing protein [Nocardioides coralli]
MHPEIPSTTVQDLPNPLPDGLAVLDVREPGEWDHGHIDGALHLPLMELVARRDEVPRDQRLLVVCKIGGRSMQAVDWLHQQGYDAVNLEGGMVDWADAGRPMVSENGEAPRVV